MYIGDEHLDEKEQLLHKLLADPLVQVTYAWVCSWGHAHLHGCGHIRSQRFSLSLSPSE